MSGIRVLIVAIALPFALLNANPAQASGRKPCASRGEVYTERLLVEHKNGKWEQKPLFLVCNSQHYIKIVDSDGRAYDDLDDFRAHNHVFTKDDKIVLPRDFPAVDQTGTPDLVTVSGHTAGFSLWWPLGGLVVLLLIAGGGFVALRPRRRPGPQPGPQSGLHPGFDPDSHEPPA